MVGSKGLHQTLVEKRFQSLFSCLVVLITVPPVPTHSLLKDTQVVSEPGFLVQFGFSRRVFHSSLEPQARDDVFSVSPHL